ncbi:MAG: type II toxin-antitoxin system VapC family toxin [Candidatus Methylomirabilaceae bacterium]
MTPASVPKYVLDTNLYIRAFRDAAMNEELQRFHLLFAPFEYLSSVVAQELIAGTVTPADRRALERNVLSVYRRRARILTPSAAVWERFGEVLAELTRKDGLDQRRMAKNLGNDILLALSCRDVGATLVTENERDFAMIAAIARFKFTKPWPAPVRG